jgi:hypothetical protein
MSSLKLCLSHDFTTCLGKDIKTSPPRVWISEEAAQQTSGRHSRDPPSTEGGKDTNESGFTQDLQNNFTRMKGDRREPPKAIVDEIKSLSLSTQIITHDKVLRRSITGDLLILSLSIVIF